MNAFRLLISAGIVAGLAPSHVAAQSTAITHITIIDVERGRAVPDQTIVIDGDKIASIAPSGGDLKGVSNIVDAKDLYALPGLFDAHVHYIDPDAFGKMMVANGVLFVRDMGGATENVLATRDKLNKGELFGPEMIATGAIVDGNPPIWPFSEACDTPEEGRAAVQKLKAAGVDQIKVYSRLKPDVYRAIVDESRKVGLKAVGHIPAAVTPDEALAAGQASDEHLMQFDVLIAGMSHEQQAEKEPGDLIGRIAGWDRLPKVETEALAARVKAFAPMMQCPTLVVSQGIGSVGSEEAAKDPRMAYVSPKFSSFWAGEMYARMGPVMKRSQPIRQQLVLAMHKAGVPIMVGTDLANPYVFAGFSVHDEMELLSASGIPAADVLRDATIVPARFMGVDSRLGTIAKGKAASFILLAANPLDNIANVNKIAAVYQRGKAYDRKALDGMLKEVRDQVGAAGGAKVATKSAIKLELPGQEVARGKYVSKFGQVDAGVESFLITRAADGYRMMAHNEPKGGFQPPSVVTMHFSPEWSFIGATFKQLSDPPLEATYVRVGDVVEVKAVQEGKDLDSQAFKIPADASFAAPAYASDFMVANSCRLEVGQTKQYAGVSFGWGGWQLSTSPMSMTRLPDEVAKGADGSEVKARVYTTVLKTDAGEFKGKLWADERGVALKSQMTMPFGTVTAELH